MSQTIKAFKMHKCSPQKCTGAETEILRSGSAWKLNRKGPQKGDRKLDPKLTAHYYPQVTALPNVYS